MNTDDETGEPLSFRDLYFRVLEDHGYSVFYQVLEPWIRSQPKQLAWLHEFAQRRGDPIPPAADEDLWELYALSRVNETLLLRFQSGRADGTDYQGPKITADEYRQFVELFGFHIPCPNTFHPFYHEIVEVLSASDDNAPIELAEECWPCVMLGPMMFSRGGVRVSGGSNHINKQVAETSTIYWAYRRKNRPTSDLSVGWGSNSQWRTDFRRDYLFNGMCHFNVDAKPKNRLPEKTHPNQLPRDESEELLLHRHFIVTEKPHDDLWPYDEKVIIPIV